MTLVDLAKERILRTGRPKKIRVVVLSVDERVARMAKKVQVA